MNLLSFASNATFFFALLLVIVIFFIVPVAKRVFKETLELSYGIARCQSGGRADERRR